MIEEVSLISREGITVDECYYAVDYYIGSWYVVSILLILHTYAYGARAPKIVTTHRKSGQSQMKAKEHGP